MDNLPLGAIKRERWLDRTLNEARLTLTQQEYVALIEAISAKDRENFVRRKVPLSLKARSMLESIDRRRSAIRLATGLDKPQRVLPGVLKSEALSPVPGARGGEPVELEIIESGFNNGYLEGYGSA